MIKIFDFDNDSNVEKHNERFNKCLVPVYENITKQKYEPIKNVIK